MSAAIRRGAQGEEFERDVRFVQHLHSQFVRVARCVPDFGDAAVDEHFRADEARLMRAVDFGPGEGNAVHRRLDDGVLLGVQAAAYLVALPAGHAASSVLF